MSYLVKVLTSSVTRRRQTQPWGCMQIVANNNTSKRYYNNNNPNYNQNENHQNLLNRLRNGSITKSDVRNLIINEEYLQRRIGDLERYNKTATQIPGNPMITVATGHTQNTNLRFETLGSSMNPMHTKTQSSFRELIFSLFPFFFIFWIFGGFDLLKNGKQAGMGPMFGKNFAEFDETDWEEEEIDEESTHLNVMHTNINNINNNNNDNVFSSSKNGIYNSKKKDENDKNDTKYTTGEKNEIIDKKRKQKRVRFKDVCGCDEAKADLMDLVDYLKNPSKYETMGCKLPKGVLMSGSPGTGKTLLARALAGEAGVPFLATNGASFDEVFVGVGVARVRKLFERAKERAPCIVFIDEIDAIGNTRMQMGTPHSSDSLNALLSEMDGFERNTGIIVIAATNMPDRLDAALVRPGRFDRKVNIPVPDKQARKQIVNLYLKDHASSDVDLDLLVSDISGFSGAELESMVNLASIEAVKEGENKVSMKHLIEAKEMISMGRARSSLELSPIIKKVTAYHESGHAIVSLFTKGSKPIYKATILPRGDALGFVASSNSDEFMATKESLLAELDVCMGGRAAEEIFNGNSHITTGASSDFGHATRLATAMVCQYGMSPKVGKMYYRIEDIPRLSPTLQNTINEEVKRLLDESYHRARSLIESRKEEMHILADTLLSKETLSGEEIKQLVNWDKDKVREPIDFIMSNNDSLNLQDLTNVFLHPKPELLNQDIKVNVM